MFNCILQIEAASSVCLSVISVHLNGNICVFDPQIAALNRGGDSFPLTTASGKVLGKVKNTIVLIQMLQQLLNVTSVKRSSDEDVCLCVQALRSSDNSSKPIYVSIGHKISVDTAVRLTHSCCRYRVPEPIRQVHTHTPIVQMVVIFWLWPSACWDIWWASIKKMHLLLLLTENKRSTETGWVFGVGEPVPFVHLSTCLHTSLVSAARWCCLTAAPCRHSIKRVCSVCDASKVWGWARRGRKRRNSK